MRALILANAGDMTASHVAAAFRSRSTGHRAELVWVHDVVASPRLAHSLDDDGVSMRFVLRDERVIANDDFDVVFNRARVVPLPAPFVRSRPADRDYAVMEMSALLTSWLASFDCAVVNPVDPPCLSGTLRHPIEWHERAARRGLAAARVEASSNARRFGRSELPAVDDSMAGSGEPAAIVAALNRPGWFQEPMAGRSCDVLVAGTQTIGPLPDAVQQQVNDVVRAEGLALARCTMFERAPHSAEWLLGFVDPWPALLDASSIGAVVRLLEQRGRE